MLKSDLCDSNDAYIGVKGRISVRGINNANRVNKKLIFKNNSLFRSCTSKANNTFVGYANCYANLLKYSDNYSVTSGSLGNFYIDEDKG